jgi:PadR family transcriptional regulator, regulatory protein PadR
MGQSLGEIEQLVLLALLRLGDEGYGIAVQREIESKAGRAVTLGAIYSTLVRLEEQGLLASRVGDPSPVRGGRRKKLYEVQPAGRVALRDALGALRALSHGLSPALDLQ